ncbi:MAG: Sugar 1,4-lactone oxidase [Cyanobacteria bacterium RYN_339]|nr:Sugar 1,4-lactone oxidase [Cyanobacteria bacterium RYN_339]
MREARRRGERVKVVGAGHSCAAIALAEDAHLVSLDRQDRMVEVDEATGLVRVEAGIRLHALNQRLAERGLALPNLGVIDDQSLAGAISTGTHGTGLGMGAIASCVVGLVVMDAAGEVHELSATQHPALFQAARTGLGACGVILRATLACVPKFHLRITQGPGTLDETLAGLDALNRAERFGFWWFPHTDLVRLWRAEQTEDPCDPPPGPAARWHDDWVMNRGHEALLGASLAAPALVPAINRGFFEANFARETSWVAPSASAFRLNILVRQRVLEYALPYEQAAAALRGLRALIDARGYRVHWPVDVRFGAADEPWLAPAQGRATCYVGVLMYRPFDLDPAWEPCFRAVDELFAGLGGRPHWGKIHWRDAADLAPRYPHWAAFQAARRQLDPTGVFMNPYLERVLGPC